MLPIAARIMLYFARNGCAHSTNLARNSEYPWCLCTSFSRNQLGLRSATKSSLSVRAHNKKQTDASRKILAVAAMAHLSPVEFAVLHNASSAADRATAADLQDSGDSKVPTSGASNSCCIK